MQLGEHADRCVLKLALALDGCVGEPVATEGVGHDVGGHLAVDVIHQKERRAQDFAGGFQPAHPRDGNVGDLADFADHLELVVESMPLSTVISGVASPGRTVDNHCDITAGSVVTSRLERCSRSTWSSTGSFGTGASFVRQLRYGG